MDGFTTASGPILAGLGQWDETVYTMATEDQAAGVDTSQPWYQDLLQFASGALQTYTQFRSQDQIMQLNLERAKAGLPPIDPTRYGPSVGVGMDYQTRNLMTWALLGAGALALFAILRK